MSFSISLLLNMFNHNLHLSLVLSALGLEKVLCGNMNSKVLVQKEKFTALALP